MIRVHASPLCFTPIRHRLGRSSRPKRPTRVSAHLDQGNAPDWIETALADGVPGVARVVNHSIVWQYLSNVDRARFDRVMAMAGEAATYNKPLARLRSEPADNVAEVRLQLWTGSNDRLLARSGFHEKPVRSG